MLPVLTSITYFLKVALGAFVSLCDIIVFTLHIN